MHLCRQPADARAERRPARDVRREVLPGGDPQGRHAEGPDIEQRGAAAPVRQALAPPHHDTTCRRPGSDRGSHGAQDGATFGSFVASGMRAATPAAATDTASPQRRLYGACPAAGGPETTRTTIAAVSRRISDSTRNGRLQVTRSG